MRLADRFTLVRIVFAPLFFAVYFLIVQFEQSADSSLRQASFVMLAALSLALIFAELTDYLDGHTARKLGQVTESGKLLDPFADVILHITLFFCFMYSRDMPAILFILIFYREFGMLFLRLQATRRGLDVAARMGGKLKTVLYIASCFWMLAVKIVEKAGLDIPIPLFFRIGTALFIACVFAAYLSFFEYIYRWIALSKNTPKD